MVYESQFQHADYYSLCVSLSMLSTWQDQSHISVTSNANIKSSIMSMPYLFIDCFTLPVSHYKVSPMKNPPRGGNIIPCKSVSPYVNLAYPVTKSPLPLQFRRSRRDTIAPSEECAPSFDRLLDDDITRDGAACRVTKRLKSIVDEATQLQPGVRCTIR